MFFKKIKIRLLFVMLSCISLSGYGNDYPALKQLVQRRLPMLNGKIIFSKIKAPKETAFYQTKNGKLQIEASAVNAAAFALHHYLKKYCNSSFSETGDNISIPKMLPPVLKKEKVEAFFPIRYALNYCTYNYTMSFWDWNDWEKELDIMALNGVNLMLAPMGTEEVWYNTLKEFNFSEEEIKQFIPGPAFNAWWLMGNLEGWGGPVSNNIIKYWTALQQKILPRMKELGITPVVQSFWGMVPVQLKTKFPNAAIVEQGKWLGMFQRPGLLMPQDSLFEKMAASYYKHFKQLYGSDFTHLGGDLFHEGGRTEGIKLNELGKALQQNMQNHFPNATWVLQGWQDNPKAPMLKAMDKKYTLVLDLLGDRSENWEKRNGYEQFPWVWCTITNFGGKQFMEGKLARVVTEPKRAAYSTIGKNIQGVGIIPEAIENNNIIYQWALESAWESSTSSFQTKIKSYVKSRYGSADEKLVMAWEYLLQSVYQTHTTVQAGGFESIFAARPDSSLIATISCCGPKKRLYDAELLRQAGLLFSEVAAKYQKNDAFCFDLVDIWRQLLNVKARGVYELLMVSISKRNKEDFIRYKNIFIDLLQLQDKWTGTHQKFMLGSWINKATNLYSDAEDKKLAEWNAKTQITYWGNNNPKTILHEYAAKEWNGILKDLHLKRWEAFFSWAEDKMNGKVAQYPDFFAIEKKWAEESADYSDKPAADFLLLINQVKKAIDINIQDDNWKGLDFYKN